MTRAWNEPEGGTPRGTLIVLPGRGETATSYERLGRRLSADAYKVRLVDLDTTDLDGTRTEVGKLLVDESLPSPKVLVGSDVGATLASTLADDADAAVLAGLALPDSATVDDWDAAIEARTACPVHRRVIGDDDGYDRDALATPVPAALVPVAPRVPTLVLHGTADPITPAAEALASVSDAPRARVRLVEGGRHDILNDVSHRSVAATIVLFLESLRLGSDLPDVIVAAEPEEVLR